jgi:hypothetical protein
MRMQKQGVSESVEMFFIGISRMIEVIGMVK